MTIGIRFDHYDFNIYSTIQYRTTPSAHYASTHHQPSVAHDNQKQLEKNVSFLHIYISLLENSKNLKVFSPVSLSFGRAKYLLRYGGGGGITSKIGRLESTILSLFKESSSLQIEDA